MFSHVQEVKKTGYKKLENSLFDAFLYFSTSYVSHFQYKGS